MAKTILTGSTTETAPVTVTTNPLQVSIDDDSIMNKAVLKLQVDANGANDWVTMAGTEMTQKLTYRWAVNPGSYRVVITQADIIKVPTNESVTVDVR